MPDLHPDDVEPYLCSILSQPVRVRSLAPIGGPPHAGLLKGYGYGEPILIEYEVGGQCHRAVLETISPGPFGHEDMADRAQSLLWDYRAFGQLPRHVRALDIGGFRRDGALQSVGKIEEMFILSEFIEGLGYDQDLQRLRDGAELSDLDLGRADALCDYLVEIHRVRRHEPGRYLRRVRELLGHSECIMGLIDSYPAEHPIFTPAVLRDLEERCLGWRWRLRGRGDRLRQVHGDFHPWNILFQKGTEFRVLDRARGEWGEPADDVVGLTMNYLFFSLQRSGRLTGGFETLFTRFWSRYLAQSEDQGMLEVAAPFFVFRGLVMASPLWYPNLAEDVRRKLLRFMDRVLGEPAFDPARVNHYLSDPDAGPRGTSPRR